MDVTDDDMLWNGSVGDGNVWSVCEGDEGIHCKGEDSRSNWESRIWYALCIKCMKLTVKYFPLADMFYFIRSA